VPNYTYSETHVLKNKLGIRDETELEIAEGKFTAARDAERGDRPIDDGAFDAARLKTIHWHLFQDVYEWAGHTRDEAVALSDGTTATEPTLRKLGGGAFLRGELIASALVVVSARISDEKNLAGLSREVFADRAADIMAELNAVHPFREGNGRTQRTFMRELAASAGHTLDFTVISQERMIRSSVAANEGYDRSLMQRMFRDISNPERVAALRQAIGFFDEQHFPWNDHYLATIEPGHRLELTMAGMAGEHFLARTRSEILVGNTSDLPAARPERGENFVLEAKDLTKEVGDGRNTPVERDKGGGRGR